MPHRDEFILYINQLRKSVRLAFVIGGFAILLSGGGLVASQLQNTHRIGDIATSRDALCTFRADIQRRAKNTAEFIKDHPDGIPGIPVATLRSSLISQQQTVISLQKLKC